MSLFEDLFKKKEKLSNLDLYQLIAVFNALIHKKDNVYINNKKEKFVLTRYGFVPVDQPNLKLLTEQQNTQINHLETEVRVLQNDLKKQKTENKKLKQELQTKEENTTKAIKNSNRPELDKIKKSYLTLMSNNHNLIEKVKQLKKDNKKLTTELIDEKGRYKILQKNTTAQQNNNEEDIISKINAVIMYAENNQIGKMLEKLKSVVAHQENLKQKSHNQKALITRLESINKHLEEELFQIKKQILNNDKK
jgi:hypothetical protein